MKISSKTSYGFRLMLCLAINYENDYVSLKDIATQENISEKFLEIIVATIKPLGLIDVKRGSKGGYKLAKPPHQIKITELFDALEGAIVSYDISENKSSETYNSQVVSDYWRQMQIVVKEHLDSKTLDNLLEDYKQKNENQMFFI
ncbi:MAG: Rrf2 family transcriptional regulator [Bacteroidales bacterium]|nr:Rrf2 family transcriptional regulator [Bacteroidales bacterium]